VHTPPGLVSLEPGHCPVSISQRSVCLRHVDGRVSGDRRIRLGIRLRLTECCKGLPPPPGTGLCQGDARERVGCLDVAAQPASGLELRNTAVVVTALDCDVTSRVVRE